MNENKTSICYKKRLTRGFPRKLVNRGKRCFPIDVSGMAFIFLLLSQTLLLLMFKEAFRIISPFEDSLL